MSKNKSMQSDYITALLSEVEKFREKLSMDSHDNISLEEALHLWIQHGYGKKFRRNYFGRNLQAVRA